MDQPHPAGAIAPVYLLPNAAAQKIVQTRRAGRLPAAVPNLARERRARELRDHHFDRASKPNLADDPRVKAALDLLEQHTLHNGHRVTGPSDVATYLRVRIGTRDQEVFTVVFLNAQNYILACEEMTKGTVSHCHIYPREIARRALQLNALRVIVSHNHPSGSLTPSPEDYSTTQRLTAALSLLDIEVADHIIVSHLGAYSIKGDRHV